MVLLHPYMPFITEEIGQALPHEGETVMLATRPVPETEYLDPEAENKMRPLVEVTRAVRNIRAESRVDPGRKVEAVLLAGSEQQKTLAENRLYLEVLAGLGRLEIRPEGTAKPDRAVSAVVSGVEIGRASCRERG